MKLRDLHPCDKCGGQLVGRMPDGTTSIQFYVVRLSAALVDLQAASGFLALHHGMTQHFRGATALADMFTPEPDAVAVVGDAKEHGGAWDEILLCFGCYMSPLNVAAVVERLNDREEEARRAAEPAPTKPEISE